MAAAMQPASSGPSIKAAKCPAFPDTRAMPAQAKIALAAFQQSEGSLILLHRSARTQTESSRRIVFSRSHQQRGPPLSSF
jgi:hypothetical protein